jgi:tetratricopeptide (TPR) repeat protein
MAVDLARTRRRGLWWWAAVIVPAAVLAAWIGWARARRAVPDARAIQAAIAERRWAEAERGLAALVERNPGDSTAWLKLGGVRAARGRDAAAIEAFGHVRGSSRARAVAATQIGELHLKRRVMADAEGAFRAAAAADPKGVEPRRRLVYVLALQQRDGEARAVLWQLYRLTQAPRALVTIAGMAMARTDAGDPGGDVGPFLARTPDDPLLRRARGLQSLREGRTAEAEADLAFAAGRLEGDTAGRLAWAESRLALGRSDDLEDVLGPEPGRPADRARWWLMRGRSLEARHRPEEAVACWKQAVAAQPGDRAAQYQLGQALARRASPEAKAHLERAESIRIGEVRLLQALDRHLRGLTGAAAYEELGRLCVENGLAAEARAWFEQALRLDPGRRDARRELASIPVSEEPPPESPQVRRRPSAGVGVGPVASSAGAEPPETSGPRFEDVADRSGLRYAYDCGAKGDLFIGDTMGGGVGLFDYDGDGWLDVYFVNGCRLSFDEADPPHPNRLFRNRRDGTFEDVTETAGVAGHGYGMGCAAGDYDGDGHTDLFVTGLGRTVLYHNRGDGTFEDVTGRAGVASRRWTTAAGFADLDGDGDLDLAVVTYVDADRRHVPDCRDPLGKPMHCPPGQFLAEADHLFRNNGDGTFTDVAAEAGLEAPQGLGLGLAAADLDEDGRLDLFVANDAAPNFFYRNLGGLKFEEVGAVSGLAYDGAGRATASMGVVAEDLDGDGRIDVFHTNFLNEPNTVHRNLGGGLFDDATAPLGLDGPSRPVTGFGTAALDADNDGRLDLFVANGHVDDRPWVGHPMAQRPHLYVGRAGGGYELAGAASAGAYFARSCVGRGVAAGDLDNDGRVDLVVVHRDAPASLLRNVSRAGHWVGLRLKGNGSGGPPVGTRAACRAGGKTAVRWVTSGTGYLSQGDDRLWFGLGRNTAVESLEIRWPSGNVQRWEGLAADRLFEIREGGEPVPARLR